MPESQQSEQVDQIAAALAKAQGDIVPPTKDKTAEIKSRRTERTHTYAYTDLASVIAAVQKPLSDNEIAWQQGVEEKQLITTLLHSSGQWLRSAVPLPFAGGGPQDLGSALSYARRYGLLAALGLAAEDDDGATAQKPHDTSKKPRQSRRAKPQQKPPKRPQQQRQPAAKAEPRQQQKPREKPATASQSAKPSEAFTKHMTGITEAPDLAVLGTVALCVHDNLKGNEWVQACEALYLRSFALCTDRPTLDTWGKQARDAGLDEETFKRIGQAFRARVKAIREAAEAA